MVESHSEADTVMVGRAIGEALRRGDVVLLMGELGAGKTQMVRGMARGIESKEPARSPTFVIVNEYRGRIRLSQRGKTRHELFVIADAAKLIGLLSQVASRREARRREKLIEVHVRLRD